MQIPSFRLQQLVPGRRCLCSGNVRKNPFGDTELVFVVCRSLSIRDGAASCAAGVWFTTEGSQLFAPRSLDRTPLAGESQAGLLRKQGNTSNVVLFPTDSSELKEIYTVASIGRTDDTTLEGSPTLAPSLPSPCCLHQFSIAAQHEQWRTIQGPELQDAGN